MRLRRPCEHGLYDDHSVYVTGFPAVDCPGGEFLPEDAIVIEKVDGEWPHATAKVIYDILAADLDNERDRLYLADIRSTVILDALAADQVGEPG